MRSLRSPRVLLALSALALICSSAGAKKTINFSPIAVKSGFIEEFGDGAESRWIVSSAERQGEDDESLKFYRGEWAFEAPQYPIYSNKRGLVVKTDAAHHAISHDFEEPVINKDGTLVLQYEVKPQQTVNCGGAYIKLLSEETSGAMSNGSPYVIMFGPDVCTPVRKVHLIISRRNEKTDEMIEHKLKDTIVESLTPMATKLYTLIITPDQRVKVMINGETKVDGSMFDLFEPPIQPPREIADPDDEKPSDWVDEEYIPDPDAKKPSDWDESEPLKVPDPNAEKPEGWLEKEPKQVPDSEAEKPDDWIEEEDGVWAQPMIPNPKCTVGCGPWVAPLINNPKYRGKWTPPKIKNPEYKGSWEPRKIPNPDFYEVKKPANLEPIRAIGFELWTMQSGIYIDNIYLGHSIEDAEKIQKRTLSEVIEAESTFEMHKTAASNTLIAAVRAKIHFFLQTLQRDPITAVKDFPDVVIGLVIGIITLLASVISLSRKTSKAAPKSTRTKTMTSEEKIVELEEEEEEESEEQEVSKEPSQTVRRSKRSVKQ